MLLPALRWLLLPLAMNRWGVVAYEEYHCVCFQARLRMGKGRELEHRDSPASEGSEWDQE